MMTKLLEINNLHAAIDGKEIIRELNLSVNKGEVHVIMGPNGAGKSTLANVIMGYPHYTVTKGNIIFEEDDITEDRTDERAKKGIFLSFQNSEEVEGITVENFLRAAKGAITGQNISFVSFRKELMSVMSEIDFDSEYAHRYLNVGFSGGEKKKNEIVQMLVLNPKLAILDETDSGLDVDAVRAVSEGINRFRSKNNAIIIITHNTRLLSSVEPDYVHILADGRIMRTGDKSLAHEINEHGFTSLPLL
ncbi:MAG: Fe-S cluster assembly ATPase SufC [Anaerolineaceae bacterium]|nr:MAG: Fe-S cluster assembly ATPase SufC [Anaerolineaceae bacterium]